MEPDLRPGDRLLVDPGGRRGRPIERGALVVLDDPEAPGRSLIKRVAALPGDVVWTGPTGIVVRSARAGAAEEDRPTDGVERRVVPDDHYFVLSDHLEGGRDSRRFGPVRRSQIRGVAWFRYHPPGRRGPLGPGGAATPGSPRT
jgi:signal peptidase I